MSLWGNDAIAIVRYSAPDGNLNRTATPIYSGGSDFQPRNAQTFVDAAGDVHKVAAVCFIGPLPVGSPLPTVLEGDVVTYNGAEYAVLEPRTPYTTGPLAHVELLLHRGPLTFREPHV